MADSRDIRLNLIGRETVSKAASASAAGLEKFEDAAEEAAHAARTLDQRAEEAEAELRRLAVAAAAMPDDLELMRKFRSQQREVNGLKKLRGAIGDVGEELGGLKGLGKEVAETVSAGFSALPAEVKAAAAAAGAAIGATMAAAAGAAIAAGVLLAVSGGALAAGIKQAARDPAVAGAWAEVGRQAQGVLDQLAGPFKRPLVEAADVVTRMLERVESSGAFSRIGQALAPVIDRLAPAFADLAEKSLPAIERAIAAAAPLFETLAAKMPGLAVAITAFFNSITKSGPGANKLFGDLLGLLTGTIVVIGVVIQKLSSMYVAITNAGSAAKKAVQTAFATMATAVVTSLGIILTGAARAFGWVPGIGPRLTAAAKEFQKFAAKANAALDSIKDETVTVRAVWEGPGSGKGSLSSRGSASASVSFGRRAAGGPVQAGRTYLTGEEGPELVTFGRAGFVHNARATAGMLGGGGQTITLRLIHQTPDGRVLREQLIDLAARTNVAPINLWPTS